MDRHAVLLRFPGVSDPFSQPGGAHVAPPGWRLVVVSLASNFRMLHRPIFGSRFATWLTCLTVLSCERPRDPIATAAPTMATPRSADESEQGTSAGTDVGPQTTHLLYPPANWRLAPPAQLANVVLWVSQIVIRHNQVDGARVSFNLTGWQSGQPMATRTREQALQWAEQLSQRAQSGEPFEQLARQFSEEPATAERGGSLGGVPAGHLFSWPEILDALANLSPGDVSLPVETEFGFHVLHRRQPAPESLVTGSRLLITHDDAPWGETVLRTAKQSRSRADALSLAERIHREANAAPNSFPALVARYSEHRDAARNGDLGTWSSREVAGNPRELETLSTLQPGHVSPPIDTLFGFQILRREPNPQRREYAMRRLQMRFDDTAPDASPTSKRSVAAKAKQLAAVLKREPKRFEALLQEYCCTTPQHIVEGRELPGLAQVLEALDPGGIATEPILDSVEYFIPQRLPLSMLPKAPPTIFELPAPSEPDVRYHASHSDLMSPPALERLGKAASAQLGLDADHSGTLLQLHALAATTERHSPAELRSRFDKLNADVESTLGAEGAVRYRAFVSDYVKQLLLLPHR